MIEILRMGEKTEHDSSFVVDRPKGLPCALLLLLESEGEFWVEDGYERAQAGSLVFFAPGQRQLYRACREAYSDTWVRMELGSFALPMHFPTGRPITVRDVDRYRSLLGLIHTEYYEGGSGKGRILHELLSALLHKLEEECVGVERPALYYSLADLRRQVYAHPERDWRIPDLAKAAGISVGYLHRVYPEYFGATCGRDIIRSRIQQACELLESTGDTVEHIAAACGYHSTEHLIRQFKEEMGMTPTQYRKKEEAYG